MKIKSTLLLLLLANSFFAQKVCNEFYYQKFTQKQLEQDVDFIREKIINAHVNPFTEISQEEFEKKYANIRKSMKEGMTQKDFYYLTKPLIVTLNDEHSGISDYCITDSIKQNMKVLPLKFKYDNGRMLLIENLSDNKLRLGDELISMNNIPISEVLKNCAETIPGDKEERISMVVEKFWLVINKFCYFITDDYNLMFKSGTQSIVKSISLEQLRNNASSVSQKKEDKLNPIDYKKFKNVGYLTVSTFNDRKTFPIEEWKTKFDNIFTQIRKDEVNTLVIDIHNNPGGNSAIGNLLISYFSDKPYQSYQGRWKKSQEYVDYLKLINEKEPSYEKIKNGDYYPIKSRLIKAFVNPLLFNGKTYVIVGKNTFSSAMMFGTIVLDNKLAEVIGEVPESGHPNHFGELIDFQTPNTKLNFRFGVKEWIRPAGNILPNKLIPSKIIDLKDKTKEQIIEQL